MKPRALPRSDIRLRENTPLARLLNLRQDEQEFTRTRRASSFLEQFQLKFTVTSGVNGRTCRVNGKPVANFASQNYLGLEQHPEVLYAAKRAIDELGTDSGAPRLVSAQSNLLELEASLSQLLHCEATLIGGSLTEVHGGVLPVLFADEYSVLFLDKNANPAMRQAALAAQAQGARVVRVDVSDPPALRRIFSRENPIRGALLLDSIYPAQGHMPDLAMLDELCRNSNVILYLDDSHGVGVLGTRGGGAVEACALDFQNILLVGSLQNAFGSFGAFVSGKAALIEFLRASSPLFSSQGALSPSAVEGALASVRISRSPEGFRLRTRLAERSRAVRARLTGLGYIVPPGDSPLIPVMIGRELKTLMAGRKLFDLGVFVTVLASPTVPRGRGALRISLTALHTEEDIEKLVYAFRELRSYLPRHENPLRQAAHVILEVGKAKWLGERYAGL